MPARSPARVPAHRGLVVVASTVAALAARYVAGRRAADRPALTDLDRRLTDLGTVDRVSILPVVERLTTAPGLRGEPGVSYLVQADDLTVLFDAGLGTGRGRTALESNAQQLGVRWADLDAVVISHLHLDHVGGAKAQLRRTFRLGEEQPVPTGLTAFVPTQMSHERAELRVTEQASVIGPGTAVLAPLPRMLFWMGAVAEQALVVNVRGRGLVVISGCGHPQIESVLAAAEQVVDASVYAVIGGLHLPVHPVGTPLLPQAVLGSPNWPWRPISEDDARHVIERIAERGPGLVALSAHDSTPWTLGAFGRAFGERYRTLRVGEPVTIESPERST